jgi:hypothetical protein
MKNKIIIGLILVSLYSFAQNNKLWIHFEGTHHDNDFYFIEDLETHARCYAITNHTINTSGYSISCVK